GNMLQDKEYSYISDFGLTRPADKPYSNDKIYDFGIIMAKLSIRNPLFYDKKHNASLTLNICNGLLPEFGKGTPEFYKELAYRCINANPNERPTSKDLREILRFWFESTDLYWIIRIGSKLFGDSKLQFINLTDLQNLGYCHKDFHSRNILQDEVVTYVSDFGLLGSTDKQGSKYKICGVLPYIAPEVLNFGVIMAELSTGNPPFYDRKHVSLALDICNGL
ncbi:7698_t:CDS:2, partial [Funneliformis geosporum]